MSDVCVESRDAGTVELPVSRYRFTFRAMEPVRLAVFSGSAWRGAFGPALKRTVCVTRLRHCEDCPLVASCLFPYLFEGRRPSDTPHLRSLSRIPVPYVLQPSVGPARQFAPGEPVTLDLSLVGRANESLVYVVRALAEAAARGVGPGRGRLALDQVHRLPSDPKAEPRRVFGEDRFEHPGAPVSPPPRLAGASGLEITLTSPLRLRLTQDLLTPDRFHPAHLVDAVVRRVSALASFHAGRTFDVDYRELKRLARLISPREAELRWEDWTRYSSRQGSRMALGGILGRCRVEVPEQSASLLRWLELGQWVGAGKGASMGLGQFRITA